MKTTLKVSGALVLAILAVMAFVPGIFGTGPGKPAVIVSSGTADLRGYGKVAWQFSESSAEFTCADSSHAATLQGKLLADMFWDAGAEHQAKTVKIAGAPVTVHIWTGYGALAAAQADRRVLVWGASSEEELAKLLKENQRFWAGASWAPTAKYPQFLDFYDLKAFKSYSHAMSSIRGEGIDSHWPFAKKFGIAAMAFQGGTGFNDQSSAPGVVDWTSLDFEVAQAVQNDGMIVICPGIGETPLWMRNRFPNGMAQPSPDSVSMALGIAQANFEGWGLPFAARQESSLEFLRRMMERYQGDQVVGGWHLYCGFPGAEMNTHGVATDYSPAALAEFRRWLREDRGLDLQAIGQRWHGDPQHFQSWDAVPMPEEHSFFGQLDSEAFRIGSGWTWQRAEAGKNVPPAAAGGIPLAMPPVQDQQLIPGVPVDFRVKFNAGDWRKKQAGKPIFLVCNEDMARSTVQVWLNGKYLGQHGPKVGYKGPFALDVSDVLTPGDNDLILRVPKGRILGPVFLTTHEPRRYPFLGRDANARFVDLQAWKSHGILRNHRQMLESARSFDADRPIILSAPSWSFADEAATMATEYGLGLQNTGRQAFYQPWEPGLGLAGGFYGTSEPGETTLNAGELSRLLGWILIDGDSSHNLFWTLEDYQLEEKKSGWFTKNRRLVELFGKSLREMPSVATLRSSQGMELESSLPWDWDLNRGELQAAHYDSAYVTEKMMGNGLAAKFPVVVDAGTEYMDESTVKAIRHYVEEGGTFIALHNTGRHSLLDADAWPISSLTGFKVTSTSQRGKIRFDQSLPIFRGWEGREFEGSGIVLNWDKNAAAGADLGLQSKVADAVALARWPDGSVAVGTRQLGKGRIIVLGSTFWRNGKDAAGIWKPGSELEGVFLEKLLSDLGVQRTANASSTDVWARKFTTKNGLQDWAIAFNASNAPVTASVSFKVANRPSQVMDLIARKPVDFEYSADGWVKIPGVVLDGLATKVFAVKRADLIAGLPFWWEEKLKYWQKRGAVVPVPERAQAKAMPVESWRFTQAADPSKAAGWKLPGFDDSSWTELAFGKWNPRIDRWKSYEGKGLYRFSFVVPEEWKGKRIVLHRFVFGSPLTFGEGGWTINGVPLKTPPPSYQLHNSVLDITDQLRPGANVLAVEVQGGFTWRGKKLSGIGGAVSLEPVESLDERVDVAGPWEVVQADYIGRKSVTFPGKVRGKYLTREIEIPAAWSGRDVFLRVAGPSLWLHAVVVNGHPIRPSSCHQVYFANQEEFNLAPFLRAGQKNRIELWPFIVDGNGKEVAPEADIEMTGIQIGCRKPTDKKEK